MILNRDDGVMQMRLELVPRPVADVDRALRACTDIVGGVGCSQRPNSYGVGLPPFTFKVSPTTKLDSAEARNTYAGASSAG